MDDMDGMDSGLGGSFIRFFHLGLEMVEQWTTWTTWTEWTVGWVEASFVSSILSVPSAESLFECGAPTKVK
jgi:hypothetical protein